jgi:hypothetical protein
MAGARTTQETDENCIATEFLSENLKRRYHFGDPDLD